MMKSRMQQLVKPDGAKFRGGKSSIIMTAHRAALASKKNGRRFEAEKPAKKNAARESHIRFISSAPLVA
jgi:hypothetical protein